MGADDYVVVRVDSRGAGRSEGVIDIWSWREAQIQSASIGPVSNLVKWQGRSEYSYYAENQWQTASIQPKHLAAMCAWEGTRFLQRYGVAWGIFCRGFVQDWSEAQVYTLQNGRGSRENSHA